MDGIRYLRPAVVLVVLFCLLMTAVSAVPPLPAEFYGKVSIQGASAPIGTTLVAKINDKERGKVVIKEAGKYGGSGLFDERLVVAATEDDLKAGSATVSFYVDNTKADQSIPFEPGKVQQLDLTTGGAQPTGTPTTNPTVPPTVAPTSTQTTSPTVTPTVTPTQSGSIVAEFTGTPTSGTAPLTVQFTDQSTGNPTMWSWDFGDGTTGGMVASPSHTYTSPGTYTVKLTASSQTGGTGTKVKDGYITVSSSGSGVKAAFTVDKRSGQKPLTVTFTDKSTGSPASWLWDFGDNSSDTVQNPVHTYQQAGIYTVSLKVSIPGGSDTKTEKDFISVTGDIPPPVALFEATPVTGSAPLAVQFKDLSIGPPTSYLWDFGDGSTSTESNPNHVYAAGGTFTVSLKVTNSGGSHIMKRDNYISVSGAGGIVADFVGTPTSGCAPLAVQFTDKSTGTPTMWSWDFGDGTTGGMVANPSHTYSIPGTYTVKLTASSQTGGSSSKVKEGYITVSPTGGIVADFVGTPTSGSAPLTVQFTDKSTGNPTMWSWDFGDGPIPMDSASCAGGNCGNIANPTHTYSAPGTYTVRLTASSQTGGSSTKVKEGYITVSQTGGIVADFVGTPTSGTAPLTVQFTDKSTGNPTMWSWDFGDGPIPMDSASCAGGNCGNIANPTHTYSAPGTYTVKLTASSQTGGSSTKVKEGYITVSPTGGIVADFVGTPTSGTAPLTVQFADKSTGNPTMWAWDFGDGPIPMDSASCAGGNCGNIANPTHTYSAPGTYTVRLTASSQTGGSSTKVKEGYITVTSTGSIIADFIVNPASGYAPMSVQFTDRSSGGPTMWAWDFGDGGHDSVGNPVHVYQTPGTYTVTLTASNSRSSNTIVKAGAVVVQPSGPGVPGRIKITYAPDRSQVYLNNALQGETKFLKTYTIENLQPGNYELKLTKPGFTDYVQRIPIASGVTVEVIADMTLKPSQNGILSVYSYPAGGSVSLDGNLVGTSPVWLSDVKPGIHQLKVTSPGYLDWSQTIDVRGGGSVTYVTAALYPGWWSPMYGYVMISSLPAGGNAFIDGVPQGMTPITISQVKPGDHTVRVEYSGYPAWEQRISVMEGRTSYVIAQMGQSSVPITQMSVQTASVNASPAA